MNHDALPLICVYPCVECQGTGLVECPNHEYLTVHDCRACDGTGDSKMEPMFQ